MNEIATFEKNHMTAFIELHQIEEQKKTLEARDKEIRSILTKGMEEHGIESIDNEYIRISHISASPGKPKLDEKAWLAEDPEGYREVFDKYNKMSGAKKAYVRITLK